MRKTVLFILGFLFVVSLAFGQFWSEDFSTGTQYTVTLGGEGEDGIQDYFIRTDDNVGHDIDMSYAGVIGYFFAGQDIDDGGWAGSAAPSQLTWSGIDITGQTNIEFSGDFGEDYQDPGDIDDSDYLLVEYQIDGGGWNNLIAFENDGTQYNTNFWEDTDFDGNGDGITITSVDGTMITFTKSIPGTGTSLDLRFTAFVNSGDEDFAIDNFELSIAGGPSAPAITHTTQTNTTSTSAITINADITDADTDLTTTTGSAPSCWYRIEGGSWTRLEDTTSVGDTFSWYIPGQSAHTLIEYYLAAQDDASNVTTSPAGGSGTTPPGNTPPASFHSYNILKSSPTIYDVQNYCDGYGSSYYSGEAVSLTGIVTGIYGTSWFTFQDGSGAWNGIWVSNDGSLLSQGDNVTIDATVSESSDLTQLTTVTGTTTNSTGNIPPTVSTILTGALDESYEGVYIFVDDAVCTNASLGYGEWEITSTASTACRVDDLGYVFTPTLNNTYDVKGVNFYSYGDFKIEPRYASDVVLAGDTTPPTIVSVSVTDENTVEVYFDEDVEETTAETTTNYTIVIRDVTVTGAVLDTGDATHVTLTVLGMTFGDYTLSAIGIEDISGNPSNDSEDFSYTEPFTGDIIINEVDADTPGTDVDEFIELYDGGIGNTALDGLAVVLYNGNGDVSYNAIDLDTYSTDANGYFVIGSSTVPNVDLIAFTSNGIQNGPDAVALYTGDATDFPNGTAVTTTNLIDALVYDTNDADDPELLVLLNSGQPQVNESSNGTSDTESNQRIPNGSGGFRNTSTYGQYPPTPGAENVTGTLDAPTDLVVTVNVNNIDLNWSVVSGATGYNIYRSTDPYNFGSTAYDSSVTNSYTDIGAASDDKYFYRVTATN